MTALKRIAEECEDDKTDDKRKAMRELSSQEQLARTALQVVYEHHFENGRMEARELAQLCSEQHTQATRRQVVLQICHILATPMNSDCFDWEIGFRAGAIFVARVILLEIKGYNRWNCNFHLGPEGTMRVVLGIDSSLAQRALFSRARELKRCMAYVTSLETKFRQILLWARSSEEVIAKLGVEKSMMSIEQSFPEFCENYNDFKHGVASAFLAMSRLALGCLRGRTSEAVQAFPSLHS